MPNLPPRLDNPRSPPLFVDEDITKILGHEYVDPEGETLRYALLAPTVHGTISINSTNWRLTYTPNPDFYGVDYFTMSITDGTNTVVNRWSINVNPVNDAPRTPDTLAYVQAVGTTSAAIRHGAWDPEADPITFGVVAGKGPSLGSVILDGDTYYYVAGNTAGVDHFTLWYEDSHGARFEKEIRFTLSADTLTISGGAGDDVLNGSLALDRIDGGAGNDTLFDRGDGDRLYGGTGDDLLVVTNIRTEVHEGAFEGYDTVVAWTGYALTRGQSIEVLRAGSPDTATDPLWLTGNEQANMIIGNMGANILDGEAGADSLYGGGGDDVLRGGAGADVLDGGTGADTMMGGAGDDTYRVDNVGDVVREWEWYNSEDTVVASVSYTLGADDRIETLRAEAPDVATTPINLTGNDFNNILNGNRGDNILSGGGGNDVFTGKRGADTLIGGAGDDVYYIDDPRQVIIELDVLNGSGQGRDIVWASTSFTLTPGQYVETLYVDYGVGGITLAGNELDNMLWGSYRSNTLMGGGGSDTINAGTGAEQLWGGQGADQFVFGYDSANGDRIGDFALGDKIVFRSVSNPYSFIGSAAFVQGGGRQIRATYADGVATVMGDTNGDTEADFVFTVVSAAPLTISDFVL